MSVVNRMLAFPRRMIDSILGNRTKLPRFVNRTIDYIAEHPDSPLGRLAARSLGSTRPEDLPAPTAAPETDVRVYIGPTNYAEQGWAWARALEASGVGARNMAVDVPGGFSFRADTEVPVPAYTSSELWQNAELEAVSAFTHVLFEAERPLFGRLFGRDVEREDTELIARGLSTAFMCHGSDIRLPSRHTDFTSWSPFGERDPYVDKLERDAARNGEMLARTTRPIFVSTPDLLADVPQATWCPVVVDVDRWSAAIGPASTTTPVQVAHVPSKSVIKGTPLIEPVLSVLDDEGLVQYSPISGVPSAKMPEVYGAADIVLDQFRLGSYGVAACEAMAAGCVVVGHVVPFVREHVAAVTGQKLPIVEATPDTLEQVLRELIADPQRRAELIAAGASFVRNVHDGRMSAAVLRTGWIDG